MQIENSETQIKIIDPSDKVLKAGGVVVKEARGKKFILLLYRGNHQDWTFPKGHIEIEEDINETIIREFKEETGLDVKIVKELPKLEYTTSKGESVSVSMFLAAPTDPNQFPSPEHEGDNVEWVPIEEVPQRLSYENLKIYFVSMMNGGEIA